MQAISDLMLSIYNDARSMATNAFVTNTFGNMQRLLRFDSAGIISLGLSQADEMLIKGVFAYKFSPEEKLRVRTELGLTERYVRGRGIMGADPHLEKCFRTKNRAQIVDSRTVPDPRVVEYAKRTGAIHVLTMVANDIGSRGFSALSLWRASDEDRYSDADRLVADLILPHFFMALTINKQIANSREIFDSAHYPPIICSPNGLIHFIEDEVFIFLQRQFPNWKPLRLPQAILEGLQADSANIYVAKGFTAKGRLLGETLLVYVARTSEAGLLTKAELKIAKLLAEDETYKQIALRVGTSPATVRNQAHSIYRKLGVNRKSSIHSALLGHKG